MPLSRLRVIRLGHRVLHGPLMWVVGIPGVPAGAGVRGGAAQHLASLGQAGEGGIAELLPAATAQQQAQAGPEPSGLGWAGPLAGRPPGFPERAVGGTGAGPQDRGAVVDQHMLVDGGGGLPGPDRCPGQGRGQLGTLGPEHLGGQLLGLGEGLGLVGSLGLVRLVAVDGGLVVGPLALRGLLAGERRLGQAAQRVAGMVGLVHVSLLTRTGNGCSAASLTVGAARLGSSSANRTRVDRIEPTGVRSRSDLVRRIAEAAPSRLICSGKVVPSASIGRATLFHVAGYRCEIALVGWAAASRAHQRARCSRAKAGCLVSTSGRVSAIGSRIVARSSRSRPPVIDPSSASSVTRAACAAVTRAATPGATVA